VRNHEATRGPLPRPDSTRCRQFVGEDEATVVVARTVARMVGVAPGELDPLHRVVDPEVVDRVAAGCERPDVELRFAYHGHAVTVRGTGEVLVAPNGSERRLD
jgi:hypothetical protein